MTSVDPANNAVSQTTALSVTATFSRAVNAGSVTADSVSLVGPQGAVPAVLKVDANKVTLTPKGPLALLASYEVKLGNTLAAVDGGAYGGSSSKFTTREGAWLNPSLIASYSSRDAIYSKVAVSDSGDVIVTWTQSDGSLYSIWSNRFDAALGTWGTAVRVDRSTDDAIYSSIAIDAKGNAIVAWQQSFGLLKRVAVSTFSVTTKSWSIPTEVTQSVAGLREPLVAMDGQGRAMIVWQQADGLYAVTSPGASLPTVWSAPTKISPFNGSVIGMTMARNSEGATVVTMQVGNDIVAVRYRSDTATWGEITKISAIPDTLDPVNNRDALGLPISVLLACAMDDAGNAIVTWHQYNAGRSNAWINRLATGSTTWDGAGLLDAAATTETLYSTVAMNASGDAMATWQRYVGGRFTTWAKGYSNASHSWGPPVEIDSAFGTVRNPSVAVDAAGNAVAVWEQYNGSRITMWANRYNRISGAWATAVQLEPPSVDANPFIGESFAHDVAASANGRVAVAWGRSYGSGLIPFNIPVSIFR